MNNFVEYVEYLVALVSSVKNISFFVDYTLWVDRSLAGDSAAWL